jgi:hypothetical protein
MVWIILLKKVYKSDTHLIICGDINYFNDSKKKRELNNILNTYNLVSIIHFPRRITNKSRTIIDNIFLDTTKIINFETYSVPTGLSDHEAQMSEIYSHILKCNKSNYKVKTIRKVDLHSIKEFKDKLGEELWQNIFDNINGDVNSNFNSFLNTYLLIFYSCFPRIKTYYRKPTNQWITKGIINSCKRKKDLFYLLVKANNDEKLKNYYLRYSKILSKIIKVAKKPCYENKIIQAHNKIKATWNVIKSDMGINNIKYYKRDTDKNGEDSSLKIDAERFNDHFSKLLEVFLIKLSVTRI